MPIIESRLTLILAALKKKWCQRDAEPRHWE
jgi:hypothetical protein